MMHPPVIPPPSACELRPGIGLCDSCSQPKWPQRDMGYGCMFCLDCLAVAKKLIVDHRAQAIIQIVK